ncbi:MAG: tRNA guanosine(34) transglycosylase Tgt [Nanoarchaeota archaeon]|nr:tRNA guanosine(34) transglycosylase Tgt [Nanoarchaeota archaeon]
MKSSNAFTITAKDKKTKARAGILHTRKGKIETPFFMPVATKTAVKHISPEDLHEMKAKAIISNALILFLRPGSDIIKKMGGIGKFMNYKGINVTDSGGFQMYSEKFLIKTEENGVWFNSPFDGTKHFITPEKNMQIQLDLGGDVAMCLDNMPLMENTKGEIEEAIRKTFNWAQKCKKEHDKLQKNIPKGKKQLLFGICQGGIYEDLRKTSATEMSQIDFDGFSIGGLALGEEKKDEYKMIEIQKQILPENKPCYLMGAGNPIELLEAISRGIDMFDSRFPTQNARRGTIFTSKGKLKILRKEYKTDKNPLDKGCKCFVCKNHSRAYIRHLLLREEATGMRLATFHNLYFLQNLMEKSRAEIKKGKFLEFKNKMKKIYQKNNIPSPAL